MSGDQFVEDLDTEISSAQVSFDIGAFDEAIHAHGVRLEHFQALPCPVGCIDLDDERRPHPDHEGCTNGFTYSRAGVITGLFTGNSKHKTPDEMGFWDASTVQVTFPRFYDSCGGSCSNDPKPFFVAPFDRLYLDECNLTVVTWQKFIHSETGKDRLKYPVVDVIVLKDSAGLMYTEGNDFVINHGQIVWTGQQPALSVDIGPGLDGSTVTRGAVCAVRYTYRPYFYVGQMMHELRVARMVDGPKGKRMERLPQQVLIHREFVATTKDQQPPGSQGRGIDADAMRTVMGAMNGGGSFGAR